MKPLLGAQGCAWKEQEQVRTNENQVCPSEKTSENNKNKREQVRPTENKWEQVSPNENKGEQARTMENKLDQVRTS